MSTLKEAYRRKLYETISLPDWAKMWSTPMELSPKGFEFIKSVEGVRTDVYLDSRHLPTVGIGHLILPSDNLKIGDVITNERVSDLFTLDSRWDTDNINKLVHVPLTQNQFDALFSLVYNIGGKAFAGSHVLFYLNQGDYQRAADAFLQWKMAGGRPVLLARREKERTLFLKEDAV